MKTDKLLLYGVSAFAFLLLTTPVFALLLQGLASQAWRNLPISSAIGSAALLSFASTAVVVCLAALLGTPLAFVLSRYAFRGKRFVSLFIELPIVMPPAVAGLALLLTFGRRGAVGSLLAEAGIFIPFSIAAVILAQFFISAPFYIRSAQVGFASIAPEIEDAARVDGAHGWLMFWYITLPIAWRALASGMILSWARALGEFGATMLFAGNLQGKTQTMPLLVYSVFERDINAAIWTGLILIALALAALFLSQRFASGQDRLTR
ncbi:MAG: ABC transporter permease [Chloroflexi bacterium]|nr:ABC transporter permease [Chloroflexota bacterium]MCY4246419.1 ABC transporter permease [Chloroflexota bacterium]